MRALFFAGRNAREILRDPLNLAFGLGFPVVLLLLLSAIQANIPVPLFEIAHLAPGVSVFGLSFMTLFSATVIAKDRGSSFLARLYTTPLTAWDFILGYTLPMILISLVQTGICYCLAMILGLEPSVRILWGILWNLPAALLFVGLGLLCGSLLNDKQVGGICGALLTNLSAWLSGIWFDLDLMGGLFRKIANCLPFVHAVELQRAVISGDFEAIFPHFCWVSAYGAVILIAAIFCFLRQMKSR